MPLVLSRRRRKTQTARRYLLYAIPAVLPTIFLLTVTLSSPRPTWKRGGDSLKSARLLDATGLSQRTSVDYELAAFYNLTSEKLWQLAPDGYLYITYASYHCLDFVLNWVYHADKAGVRNYVVGCMGDRLLSELNKRGIPAIDMHMDVSDGSFPRDSKDFFKSGEEMVRLNLAVLQFGITVIGQDIDTVWLRDPTEIWERYPRADVLCSSDHLFSTTKGDRLEDLSKYEKSRNGARFALCNTGLYVLRPSALDFTQFWLEAMARENATGWDQQSFWDISIPGQEYLPNDPDRLLRIYNGTLLMGLLPASTFMSGHPYFVQHLSETMGVEPYIVHATFQYSGFMGKRHRLRDALLWKVDPPEYYDTPGGFLAWDLDVPKDLLAHSAPKDLTTSTLDDVQGHFDLVNYQFTQIRNALQVAKVLNRTLIFNEFWCGHDRWWDWHNGSLPNVEMMKMPFVCPLDYVLDLSLMKSKVEVAHDSEMAPFIDFRESSFLRNERLPGSIKLSELRVEVCSTLQSGCAKGEGPAAVTSTTQQPTVYLSPNLTDIEIRAAFQNLSSYKLLRFSSMRDIFGGFQNPTEAMEFETRIAQWASMWCCVRPLSNDTYGHVWLDLFHDVLPHTDTHGRVWNKTHRWVPVLGPL